MPKNVFHGGGPASSNWRYFTEADRTGPRRQEMIMSTTVAKERFMLATSDLQMILGFRRPAERSTLTMYYVNDLKAAAIAKFGQTRFDNEVPEGRELSGVAAKERAEKAEKERVAAQASSDQDQYAVVPPERLGNKRIDQLHAILERCGDHGKKPKSKAECVERILKAGYDEAKERGFMEKQKAADDARRAQLEVQRAEHAAQRAKADAEAAARAKVKAAEKAERLRRFVAGDLDLNELKYDEIQEQLAAYGVAGKERVGKKEELRARLERAVQERAVQATASSASKRKADELAADLETGPSGPSRKVESKAVESEEESEEEYRPRATARTLMSRARAEEY